MNDLLNWAEFYASKGFKIFPLIENGKTPKIAGGFKKASSEIDQIKKWWGMWPNANIGLATGENNLFVIDVDNKNGANGEQSLKDANIVLEDTLIQVTPTGGKHYIYKDESARSCKVNVLNGVDIRATGGYIVLAPSKINGKSYQWLKPINNSFNDSIRNYDGFLDEIYKQKDSEDDVRFFLPLNIEEGKRNETLFKYASKMQAQKYTDSQIQDELIKVNSERCDPPLDSKELKQLISSVFRYKKGKSKGNKGQLVSLKDVEGTKTEWLWYPYIPKGKITLLVADPGTGKTMLALQLMATLSKGGYIDDPNSIFKGNFFTESRSIYLTAEDGYSDTIKPRLEQMKPLANFKNIAYIDDSEEPIYFDSEILETHLKEYKPSLLVFDPVQAYLGEKVDMHRANEVRPKLKRLGDLAEKTNCAILLIMHMSKMSSNSALYRALGSIDFVGAARSVIQLVKNPEFDGQIALCRTKTNLAPQSDSILFHIDLNAGGLIFNGYSKKTADDFLSIRNISRESPKKDRAEEFLCEILENGPMLKETIVKKAEAEGISKSTLENARRGLGIEPKSTKTFPRKSYWGWPEDLENFVVPIQEEIELTKNNVLK